MALIPTIIARNNLFRILLDWLKSLFKLRLLLSKKKYFGKIKCNDILICCFSKEVMVEEIINILRCQKLLLITSKKPSLF